MHPWHYFEELDTFSSQHGSLPASLDVMIGRLKGVGTINISLNEAQSRIYFQNGKFVFKNKELRTSLLGKKTGDGTSEPNEKSSKRLVFASGETNPLLFLNEFEKCSDTKCDKEKKYKILDFVDECHKGEFTKLYFTSDWPTVKSAFLKSYALSFAQNKKKELNINYEEASSLRSFFELKLTSLSKFTSLPFINQVEMVINDLPVEISSLFIVNEVMTGSKTEILNFCDTVHDLVENCKAKDDRPDGTEQEAQQSDDIIAMDIFHFTPESEEESMPRATRGGRGRGRDRGSRGGVRGGKIAKKKNLKVIPEENASSESGYDFLKEVDNSSVSSWTDGN